MKSQNPGILAVKFVAKELVGDVLYWPLWWYSRGLVDFIKKRIKGITEFEENIGLTIWVINWSKPMYGQYDIAGKLISLVIRTLGIFWKGLQLMVYLLVQVILLILWLVVPLLAVYGLWRQFF